LNLNSVRLKTISAAFDQLTMAMPRLRTSRRIAAASSWPNEVLENGEGSWRRWHDVRYPEFHGQEFLKHVDNFAAHKT
jgi:hypothetical protein